MRFMLMLIGLLVVGGIAYYVISPDDKREEMLEKLDRTARREGEAGEKVPKIVREQQRKERIRQNNTWTAENRALHPIEYCQAQLEELEKYSKQLDVAAHEVACAQSAVNRAVTDGDLMIECLNRFVEDGKTEYRKRDKDNSWPASIGGFVLTKDRLKEKMVDAVQKVAELQKRSVTLKNQLTHLEKKSDVIVKERKVLAKTRQRVETTISDLKLQKVIEGEKSVTDALNAIADSMNALGVDYDNPDVEEVAAPTDAAARDKLFEELMSK